MNGLEGFSLVPGRRLAGKYLVGELLGKGWEGEVYHVTERATGIERAAKIFFPKRNPRNRSVNFYARKLNKLRDCSIIIQYHTQETFRFQKEDIPFLVSEYVEGELLSDLLKRQRGQRLQPFEALHMLYSLVRGVEEIHRAGEYHGDLHSENFIVNREGLGFRVKVVDMYHWGRPTAEHFLHLLRPQEIVDRKAFSHRHAVARTLGNYGVGLTPGPAYPLVCEHGAAHASMTVAGNAGVPRPRCARIRL
jgi:serine/threonine protein kinase